MASFALYAEYTAADIRDAFESPRAEGAFLVTGERAACLAQLGAGPEHPSFPERSTFHWPFECPAVIIDQPLSRLSSCLQRPGPSVAPGTSCYLTQTPEVQVSPCWQSRAV